MYIIDISCLRGPNYWSIKHTNLVVMKLDLEQLEDFPTNKISGFYERLQALLPSLDNHECSEGHRGGFFLRVQEGTWMGHVIEHIALEIQTLAGIDVGFGRTRGTGQPGVYNVVFAYQDEQAGIYAARCAVAIAEALVRGCSYNVAVAIDELRRIYETNRLGPSTSAIVSACTRRGIPHIRLNADSYVQLGYGAAQQRIQAAVTGRTSSIAVELAADKSDTKQALSAAGIPVPFGAVVSSEEGLEAVLREIDFPLVVKPLDGNHGRGVTTNIQNVPDLFDAFLNAKRHSEQVVIEQFITGNDYRLLVINYRLYAAAWRLPAMIVGNGYNTIRELIDEVNRDPRRGEGHQNVLTKIDVDLVMLNMLAERQLTLESPLPAGERLFLKDTANLSTGGTAIDVTDELHPEIAFMAERAARAIGLDICGIDLIADDIRRPLEASGASVIEVNAGPGLRMHTHPSEGKPRDVGGAIAEMLFPTKAVSQEMPSPGKFMGVPTTVGRIPLIAVTGTNGKTTTTRLLAHIYKQTGRCVGFTTTEGVYIGNHRVEAGDCTGPASARNVLCDTSVEVAVLECARGGMLRAGLAFDQCDVGVVTNVAADHLGLRDIHSLEDMAHVKAIVPESVRPDGYAVLNADNDHTYAIRERVRCQVALFSRQPGSERVQTHCATGGVAAVCDNGFITIIRGSERIEVEHVRMIPLTFGGKCPFMIENALAATLAAFCQGVSINLIAQGLRTFEPSDENTPGRMNIFLFQHFSVLVDYAHNPHGLSALGEFIHQTDATHRVGILTGVGDRRDEDLLALGKIAGAVFDEVIVRLDKDVRGRDPMGLVDLVRQGVWSADPSKPVSVIPDELAALNYAIQNAQPGSLIVHLTEQIEQTITIIKEYKKQDERYGLPLEVV
ncbi:cyanophycin synthetase [Spirosoma soli]|uniref:Cyanophycin synthetase n=1 Tax=Spirosoma soli TaxID=1770529 RepID=A0ABW5LXZ5_9BACT